jgi:Phasin protein
MLRRDDKRPIGKSGQRKRKAEQEGKKPEPRRRKAAQQQDPQPVQLQDAPEAISALVTSTANSPTGTFPSDSSPVVPVASAETVPVSYRTIAKAYRNYTRQSLDQTRSFFEKLGGVRSPDKAFELQTEFAKQAYESFVAESQKIRELHGELALKIWEGLVVRTVNPRVIP